MPHANTGGRNTIQEECAEESSRKNKTKYHQNVSIPRSTSKPADSGVSLCRKHRVKVTAPQKPKFKIIIVKLLE